MIDHNPEDFECACEDCLQEQIERLDEMLEKKRIEEEK